MSKKTKILADEIFDRAKNFFDGSFGHSLGNYNPSCCMEFPGEIGFVDIAVEGSTDGCILQQRYYLVHHLSTDNLQRS